jgi:clan AA aspartic protease (TIGR02281 family)
MLRSLAVGTILVLGLGAGPLSAADTKAGTKPAKPSAVPAEAKATLEAAGLRITTSTLTLPEETEFRKSLGEMAKRKKAMMLADRDVYALQREIDEVKSQIRDLKSRFKNLSTQLANVTDVASNNRLVGALNATRLEGDQLEEKNTKLSERLKGAKKQAADIRDEFIRELFAMRAQADGIPGKWKALAADPAVEGAVEAVNESLGTKFVLQPASSFVANCRQLKVMEEAVSSEAIQLENEKNSLWVNVTINDKHKQRMLVDSGASSISLSDRMARDMGIKTDVDGVPIRVSLADGRQVPAVMLKLDSVRIGKFTVEDVECCVLGPEAVDAPPLLGMSFLGQFKFEVDANQAALKLTKVDSGEPPPKEKSRDRKKPAKRKK